MIGKPHIVFTFLKKVSEYDKDIPQMHTADIPMEREEEPQKTTNHMTSGRQ